MTEIAPYAPPPGDLVRWAEEAKAAHMLATSLVKTSFAGQYKGKAEDATAAIMKGAEIGLTPLAALGSIHLIQGTPALSANALRAVVQAQGHEVWIESSSDKKAVAKARRRGSDVVHTSTWGIDRATALGLTGKDNWRKQPEAMLIARATSEVCRLVAADAILGIAHSVEELADSEAEGATTRRRAVPAKLTADKIKPSEVVELPGHEAVIEHAVAELDQATTAVETELGGQVIDTEPVDTDPGPADVMTQAQRAALHAAYRDAGITDRTRKLAYAIDVIGRDISTSAQLTRAEASDVIDALKREDPA